MVMCASTPGFFNAEQAAYFMDINEKGKQHLIVPKTI